VLKALLGVSCFMPQFIVSFYQLNPMEIIGQPNHITCWYGELMFYAEKLSTNVVDGTVMHVRGSNIHYYIRKTVWVEITKEEFFTLTKNEMAYVK
jgi:hypothetical protein